MAYQSKDLSVLAYANGFTLWHYLTTDNAAAVNAAGYFNAAADMLRAGDIVIANLSGGATLLLVAAAGTGSVQMGAVG